MLSIKNAFRRPLATIFGILIIVAEVAFICIGVGQAIYAKRTIKSIDYSYTTVALMTEKYQIKESGSHNQMVAQGTVPEEIKNTFNNSDISATLFGILHSLEKLKKVNDKYACCLVPTTYELGKSLEYAHLISEFL